MGPIKTPENLQVNALILAQNLQIWVGVMTIKALSMLVYRIVQDRLDRAICYNSQLKNALVSVSVSFDSAIKSNISVGCPINIIVYNKNHLICRKGIIIPNNDIYFKKIRSDWNQGLIELVNDLDMPPKRYYK